MGGEALLASWLEGTFKADGKGPTEDRRGPRAPREGSAFDSTSPGEEGEDG